jgi:hypothetical protein
LIDQAVRQDDVEAELLADHRDERKRQLRAARHLARIDRSRHYVFRGCSSMAHYGEMRGRSARETCTLVAVGKAVAAHPELEEKILAGTLSLDAVAALNRLYEHPKLMRDGEDWLMWAEQWSARELERAICRRVREAESGEPTTVLTAILTVSGRDRFDRARQLASRKKNKHLSEGETVEVLSDHYLDSFDPDRKQPRPRRTPDTSGRPGRDVPAEVDRTLRCRWGDRCAVPRCDHHIWLHKAHIRPHRRGGSREALNLHYLCWEHHVLFDAGLLQITGTPEQPVFHFPGGEVLGAAPRAPPES